MLADELYNAMLEAGHMARSHKIPGPLAHTMIDIAQISLDHWHRDEETAMRFVAGVMVGPTHLRATTLQLPGSVASACWRLIGLLEYLADLNRARQKAVCPPSCKHLLQSPRFLGGTGGHKKISQSQQM